MLYKCHIYKDWYQIGKCITKLVLLLKQEHNSLSLSGFEIITFSSFFLFRILLVTHLMRTPHHQIIHTTYLHWVLQYIKECKVVTLMLFG